MSPDRKPKEVPVFVRDEDIPRDFGPLQRVILKALSIASEVNPITVRELAEIVASGDERKTVHTAKVGVEVTLSSKAFADKLLGLGLVSNRRRVNVERVGIRFGY